jgi:flagellar P-ring protein precursor FlgI
VVSERTQTIVAGGDVRLAPAVVMHGGLTVIVKDVPHVAAPAPGPGARRGATPAVVATLAPPAPPASPATTAAGAQNEKRDSVRLVPRAATLADVSSALNALGLSPRELASVLEAMHTAGALEAEVVVQ